jgi:hypothetical protein
MAHQNGSLPYRKWISSILENIASSSGFAMVERLKYIPPFGADKDLREGKKFQEIADRDIPKLHSQMYLEPAGTETWKEPWKPTDTDHYKKHPRGKMLEGVLSNGGG